jgi:hypothetical protein
MQTKIHHHAFKLAAAFVLLLAPLTHAAAQTPNPAIQPFVGAWVGQGWGWEERFRQGKDEFVRQFPGASSLPAGPGSGETVMSLIVRHDTRYDFNVDEQGNITGEGEITYDLFPNLCGVAVLTKQVNEQVNMMSKMTTILEAATSISKEAVSLENKEFFEEETEAAEKLEQIEGTVETLEHEKMPAQKISESLATQLGGKKPVDMGELVRAVIFKHCFDPDWRITGTIPACLDVFVRPLAKEAGSGEFFKEMLGIPIDIVYDKLKEKSDQYFESLDEHSEQEASACSGTGDALAAGTKVGPSNNKELVEDMAPEVLKGALDLGMGSPPLGLALSIPGLTQVQYYYKGLTHGPESRSFKLKGHVVPDGKGAKVYLEMDGDVTGGDKQLYVEYAVNYKKEVHPFPTWSPFLDKPADAQVSGTEPVYSQKSNSAGKQVTVQTDLAMGAPFATLHETGTQRNGVKAWHGYEYFWNAWKVMEPIPATAKP